MYNSYPRIDLHGYDREYASFLVKDFIRDNHKLGKKNLIIIHGKGLGILRKQIHHDLSKNKLVDTYQINMYNDGETIVKLK